MPFSSQSGKAAIKWVVDHLPHATALDIGCGSGTYARMFPDAEWTGVEIWEPYVKQFGLKALYPTLHVTDARSWRPTKRYDIAFAGDVLEHMTAAQAKVLMNRLRKCSDSVVVSIPLGHYPQGEFEGNPHEAHVTDHWTDETVRETLGDPTWSAIDAEIGVYVWTKHAIKPRICVYAISKNEEQFVERFCTSAAPADMILIADTGSTDMTVELAGTFGAVVRHICITPWRFDDARNAALAMIPREMDICVSLDLDEELQPGWREEIERVWTWNSTRLRYGFDWGAGIVFFYEKIHARHGYRWHHPCHEYPVPDRITERWALTDMLMVIHKPDPTKSRGQYLDLLEASVREDPRCPRNAFYYARELSFHSRWNEAIAACEKYLAMPEANWPNERCYAMRVMSRSYAESGRPEEALNWARRAIAEAPNTREPWCETAMLAYRQERWAECYGAAMSALAITNRELVYTCDPAVWGSQPHDLAAIAAWHLGMHDEARNQARLAIEKEPDNLRLHQNLKLMEEARAA